MRKELGALGLAALLAGSSADARPPKPPAKMEQRIKTAKRSENTKLAPGVEEAIHKKFGPDPDAVLPAVLDDAPPKRGKKEKTKPVRQEPPEPHDPDMILPPVLD